MPSVAWNREYWIREFSARRGRGDPYYGRHWGNPEEWRLGYWLRCLIVHPRPPGFLREVLDRHLRPHAREATTALEIGPGGGRWTKYLLGVERLYLVDVSGAFLAEVARRFPEAQSRMVPYRTRGCELRGIPDGAVDFVFSFACFVHIDPEDIERYLAELWRVMRAGATAVLHYADRTKRRGRRADFSDMTPRAMEAMLARRGFALVENDTRLLNHSAIAVFRRPLESGRGPP